MTMLANRFMSYLASQKIKVTKRSDIESLHHYFTDTTFDEDIEEMFHAFFFVKYQVDKLPHYYKDFWVELVREERLTADFFELNTGSVEIVFGEELELIYFIKQPATGHLY